jgi:dTDP-4-dehydrorhamnose reductase
MKKVLIIGSRGMLGQELVKAFEADKEYEVTAWDLPEIDVTDEAQIDSKISILAPQIIINATGYNDVDKAEQDAEFFKAIKLNGLAPRYLAEAARECRAILVHYSSDYVFDGREKSGYFETDHTHPICRYGESKLIGEQAVRCSLEEHYVIRLQRLFGEPAKSNLAKKSFFSKMLELAETQKTIDVINSELGNFTYAVDLAVRTRYLIEHVLPFGVYHITNETPAATWYGAAKILFSEILKRSDVELTPVSADKFKRPATRPEFIILRSRLHAMRPWPMALAEFLQNQ